MWDLRPSRAGAEVEVGQLDREVGIAGGDNGALRGVPSGPEEDLAGSSEGLRILLPQTEDG